VLGSTSQDMHCYLHGIRRFLRKACATSIIGAYDRKLGQLIAVA
jgi:hypothetical protein